MGTFRAGSYDPRKDSSSGTESYRPGYQNDPPGWSGVILDRSEPDGFRVCPCGCREKVAGKSVFRMGHDQRLRGILIRAHLTGTPIHNIMNTGKLETLSAVAEALRWNSSKHDWVAMLEEAEAKQGAAVREAIERAEAEVTSRALGPQVGSRKLLKLGRWDYTGLVLAVYADDGEALYEYVSRDGKVQQIRKPLEGANDA